MSDCIAQLVTLEPLGVGPGSDADGVRGETGGVRTLEPPPQIKPRLACDQLRDRRNHRVGEVPGQHRALSHLRRISRVRGARRTGEPQQVTKPGPARHVTAPVEQIGGNTVFSQYGAVPRQNAAPQRLEALALHRVRKAQRPVFGRVQIEITEPSGNDDEAT